MPGIPSGIDLRLRKTLVRCGPLDNDDTLNALFTDVRLYPWRDYVSTARNRTERAAMLLDTLHDQADAQGENALVLLLRVLADQTDPSNACHRQLIELADELGYALRETIFICYKRQAEPDNSLALYLYRTLTEQGYCVFIDQTMRTGTEWLEQIDAQIKASNFLIILLSQESADSEMVQSEVLRAYEYRKLQGYPIVLPVRIAYEGLLPYTIAAFISQQQYVFWQSDQDTVRIGQEILEVLRGHLSAFPREVTSSIYPEPLLHSGQILSEDGRVLDSHESLSIPLPEFDPRVLESLTAPGGTVRLRDTFYIERDADAVFKHEIEGVGTMVTIRAPRQSGKSSLLVRGIYHAGQLGMQIVTLDLQRVNENHLQSIDTFLRFLAEFMVRKLHLDGKEVDHAWSGGMGAQDKLTLLMEDYILPESDGRIVLALDEVDRLLETPFHSSFFALMRAWYNSAAYEPIWEQLNMVLVISTEPHLLIRDINQSPFNVGLKLYLQDFTLTQVHELNRRHGLPVAEREISQLFDLLGGHPYLTRKALYTLVSQHLTWAQLMDLAISDQGPFADHLRRYHWLLRDQPDLLKALQQVINAKICSDDDAFHRLLRAGLVKGSGAVCEYRCALYRQYFEDRL
jgi:hypothetical protein